MGAACFPGVQVQHDAIHTNVVLHGGSDPSAKALGIREEEMTTQQAPQTPAQPKKSMMAKWYAKNFLDSQIGTVIAGFVILAVIIVVIRLTR